ncbi:MAG: hypothetical protein FDX18_10490 [Chlorobium sp.]|nr:MAG: hypothetical protein FDX18_10490 [Chlorobium sp.]
MEDYCRSAFGLDSMGCVSNTSGWRNKHSRIFSYRQASTTLRNWPKWSNLVMLEVIAGFKLKLDSLDAVLNPALFDEITSFPD